MEAEKVIKSFPVDEIRREFPVLHQEVNGFPLVYMDNAASSQKPRKVIDAIGEYYSTINSNVHRGVHHLSQKATDAFEGARQKIQKHINAAAKEEIIFTRGTTEAINLVARSFGKKFIHQGDEILISEMEHHSNIVPWQMVCEERGAKLQVIPMNDKGELLMDAYESLLNDKTRIVALSHISNAMGSVNPVKEIIRLARLRNIPVLIDGAQAIPHSKVDVRDLDADFYAFSGHKVYGPTGIGVLYARQSWLEQLPPWQGGGEMISTVSFKKTEYAELPYRFEAGTPNIEGAIVLGHALDYVNSIGLDRIREYEDDLHDYALAALKKIGGVKMIGDAREKSAVLSFVIDGIHHYDLGVLLDQMGLGVRTGHHCAQPVMEHFGITGTVRASLAFYNTKEEVDRLIKGIEKAKMMLS